MTPLYRRVCFERVCFDEPYRAEGQSIYLKLALCYKFDYVVDDLAAMRDHPTNAGKNTELMYRENQRYGEAFFALPELRAAIRRLLHRRRAAQAAP